MINVTLDIFIYKKPESAKRIVIKEPATFIIGRSSKADLQIDKNDRFASRNHCLIDVTSTKCLVIDLSSRNGTFVNGKKITEHILEDGDEIKIGNYVVRVSIKDMAAKRILCNECGNDVTEEALILFNDKLSLQNYICTSCHGKSILASDSSKVHKKTKEEIARNFICSVCSKDLSGVANRDCLAYEFEDSIYICRDCTKKEKMADSSFLSNEEFTVIKEIGRGSMGIVYKSVHIFTGRLCAIKRLHPSAVDNNQYIQLFEREIAVQSKIIHPNLVRLMDNGIVDDSFSFVMEYMPGGNLLDLIGKSQNKFLPPSLACYIAIEILNGLSKLHEYGFIHRDIKPSNVVLSMSTEHRNLRAKICDYGLAKSFKNTADSLFSITKTGGEIGGSIMFMSPELIRNYKYCKPPVDVYAAGATLYYMLTGNYTVDFANFGSKPQEVMGFKRHPVDVVLEEPPVPLLKRRPDLPDALGALVDKAVSKQPDKGFQSAAILKAELEKIMQSQKWY